MNDKIIGRFDQQTYFLLPNKKPQLKRKIPEFGDMKAFSSKPFLAFELFQSPFFLLVP